MSEKRKKTQDSEIFLIGKTYYYRGTPPGAESRVEESLRTDNFTEAKRRKVELVEKYSRAGVTANRLTFGVAATDFLKDRQLEFEIGAIREGSLREAQYLINDHLKPFFFKYKLEEIDQALFDRYVKHKKHLVLKNHKKVLSKFFNWCVEKKYVRYVPKYKLPLHEEREAMPLTDEEVRAVFKYAKGRMLLFCAMYLFMGLRSAESRKLTWSRVDFDRKLIFLPKSQTKTKKLRAVPMNPWVYQLLLREFNARKNEYVFPNHLVGSKVRQPLKPHADSFKKAWAQIKKKGNLRSELIMHDMRATWETHAHLNPSFTDTQREKMAGAKIDVQKDIYVKLDAEKLRPLAEAVVVDGLDEVLRERLKKTGRTKVIGENAGGKLLTVTQKAGQ